jgi:hypothetical protein
MIRSSVPFLGLFLGAALLFGSASQLSAQDVSVSKPSSDSGQAESGEADARQAVRGEYIVHFASRPFDLSALRAANRAQPDPDRYAELVQGIVQRNETLRRPFAKSLEQLGGEVIEHYWIINASAIRIDAAQLGLVQELPGVARVQPNYVYEPALNTATNSANHNSDAANRMTANSQYVTGTGVTIAILDTGADSNMGGTNRPHRIYYANGSLSGRNRLLAALDVVTNGVGEDYHSHGTMVAHCAGGASWSSTSTVDDGIAPNADLLGIKITSGTSGSTASTYLTRGWQRVLSDRQRYGILVANNSYSGSPNPRDSTQQALDSCAYNGDVLITVPSGNNGTNILYTQAGYNGINVGSVNKNTRSLSSFSGRGTTSLGKQIPDMVAVGASVYMARPNNETSIASSSGTSFSSPIVAGAAALVRQADANLSALETKAILLNTTEFSSGSTSKGSGFMRADFSVTGAVAQDVYTEKLTTSQAQKTLLFQVKNAGYRSVTITWHRSSFSTSNSSDLNLRILDSGNRVVGSSSRNHANSYEKVEFTAAAGIYRAEVSAASIVGTQVEFAIAGAGQPLPPTAPTLTGISVAQYPVHNGGNVTLTGTSLDTVTSVLVGTQQVSPVSATATQLVFTPPVPSALGQVAVKVQNAGGTSGALNMDYVPVAQPSLVVVTQLFTMTPNTDTLWMKPTDVGICWVSPSTLPTQIPGVLNLGIGAGFTQLIDFGVFVPDAIGRGFQQWAIPPGFTGLMFHQQCATLDTQSFSFPLTSSNVVTRTVIF